MYYREKQHRLEAAISQKHEKKSDSGDNGPEIRIGYYVEDFDNENAIVSEDGKKFKVPYTEDGENFNIGEKSSWTQVEVSTDYKPMSDSDKAVQEDENMMKKEKEKGQKVAKDMMNE